MINSNWLVIIKINIIIFIIATSSNCGKLLKDKLLTLYRNIIKGRGNNLGYSKNVYYVTMDNPQPSSKY